MILFNAEARIFIVHVVYTALFSISVVKAHEGFWSLSVVCIWLIIELRQLVSEEIH